MRFTVQRRLKAYGRRVGGKCVKANPLEPQEQGVRPLGQAQAGVHRAGQTGRQQDQVPWPHRRERRSSRAATGSTCKPQTRPARSPRSVADASGSSNSPSRGAIQPAPHPPRLPLARLRNAISSTNRNESRRRYRARSASEPLFLAPRRGSAMHALGGDVPEGRLVRAAGHAASALRERLALPQARPGRRRPHHRVRCGSGVLALAKHRYLIGTSSAPETPEARSYNGLRAWAVLGSNQRPPPCRGGALPAELTAREGAQDTRWAGCRARMPARLGPCWACSTTCTATCRPWRRCWRTPATWTAGCSAATTRCSARGRPTRSSACARSTPPGSAATASAGPPRPRRRPSRCAAPSRGARACSAETWWPRWPRCPRPTATAPRFLPRLARPRTCAASCPSRRRRAGAAGRGGRRAGWCSATPTWPFARESAGGIALVNPGSVGMPFDGDPRAAYAVLHDGRPHRAPPRGLRPRASAGRGARRAGPRRRSARAPHRARQRPGRLTRVPVFYNC